MKSTPSARNSLHQGVDQGLGGAGEAVVAPHQHHVDLAPARRLEQPLVARPVVPRPRGVVDELGGDGEAAAVGVVTELPQLGLGVLALVVGRDAGVERGSAGCRRPWTAGLLTGAGLHGPRGVIKKGLPFPALGNVEGQGFSSAVRAYRKGPPS
jgi:hypothetical protein